MLFSFRPTTPRWLSAISWLYIFSLLTWFLAYLLFGDGFGYLGLLNALAVYLFFPIPAVALVAIMLRKKEFIFPLIACSLLFFVLWGPLFLPNSPLETDTPQLRVMTFNILGRAGANVPVLHSIRAESPDVIFLQEVTPDIATFLTASLSDEYPYQVLQPAPRARGLGVFSRIPVEPVDIVLEGAWVGSPQILSLEWSGKTVTLVNFHNRPTGTFFPRWVRRTFEDRNRDMQVLADFASAQSEVTPVIIAGDANINQLNRAYKYLAAVLKNAWWEAGQGLGHTFPGPIEEGVFFSRLSFLHLPHWLVRIDHIFYSIDFHAQSTTLAEFYGGTDHRGVVTDLILLPE